MNKNQIRLQYSGFVVFAAQVLSIFSGLAFTLLLTRNMNAEQFGIWTNIFDYAGFFAFFSGLLPFWVTRFVARNKEDAIKTGVLTQLLLASVSVVLYFPIITLISRTIKTEAYLSVYFIAGLYILNLYAVAIFESVLRSWRPQLIGYGLLVEEATKIAIASVLIIGLKQVFLGAMLSIVVSGTVQSFFYMRFLVGELGRRVNWKYFKEWLKGSLMIIYNNVGGQFFSSIFILLFVLGGPSARAYYQAALTFANIIGYSASLAFALYPKLLAKDASETQVKESFRTILMVAIPLSVIIAVMSNSFLSVLKASYGVASPVLIILTFNTFVGVIYSFYTSYVIAMEEFDAEGKIPLHKLVRNKIFAVFSVPYIQAAIALPLAYYALTCASSTPVQAVVHVTIILLSVNSSALAVLYLFMHRSVKLPVDWESVAKYVTIAIFTGTLLFLLPATSTLVLTLLKAAGGFAFHFALLLLIDRNARALLRSIWREINLFPQRLTRDKF